MARDGIVLAMIKIGASLPVDGTMNCVANGVNIEDSATKPWECRKEGYRALEYVRRGPHDSPPVTLPLLPSA